MDGATDAWFDRKLAGCSFADGRLNKPLRKLLERMEGAMGASILWPARTGRTPRQPIAFSPVSGSAKRRSWQAISSRREGALADGPLNLGERSPGFRLSLSPMRRKRPFIDEKPLRFARANQALLSPKQVSLPLGHAGAAQTLLKPL
jgi:hypothetical protein